MEGSGDTTKAYVYAIVVDGTLRYVGKGRGTRLFVHLIEAKRSALRCGGRTTRLSPRMHRKLVEAVRAGSAIFERVIVPDLSDAEAYRLESNLVVHFHRFCPGQLWNTIDERFMDRSTLPDEWNDPEHPLYKVTRPLPQSRATNVANGVGLRPVTPLK
ncbi:MAG TPA: hypothetical protein VHD86_15395 [Xanthobacteraceae bacterium]|nr:hypothetical protein [Xanthobacteraceae bacterium]